MPSNKNSNNKSKKKSKQKHTYHLVIYDENTLREVFNFKLTKGNLYTYFGLLFMFVTFLVVLLLVFTPLNMLIPKYEDMELRSQAIQNRILIDSLKHEIDIRDNYFKVMRTIVMGKDLSELQDIDSSQKKQYLTQAQHDSLLEELSKQDNTYYQVVTSQSEGASLSSLRFYKPVSGVVVNKFNPAQGHYGIDLSAKKDEPVLSVLSGTVIMSNWNPNTGYVIMIQHPHNLISVYKHNSELLKSEGDRVEAGEPVAIVGNTGENTTGPHLHFELWYNGTPVNPADYIIF